MQSSIIDRILAVYVRYTLKTQRLYNYLIVPYKIQPESLNLLILGVVLICSKAQYLF